MRYVPVLREHGIWTIRDTMRDCYLGKYRSYMAALTAARDWNGSHMAQAMASMANR